MIVSLTACLSPAEQLGWEPTGLSGGGGMFSPAISPANPDLMMLNCDMSAAYLSEDGGHNWSMIQHAQLRSDTACRPAFHPTDSQVIYASSGGRLKFSHDRGKTFAFIGNVAESLGGLYLTDDSGQSWRRIGRQGPQTFGGYFHSKHEDWIYMTLTEDAPGAGLWLSRDNGKSWQSFAELPFSNIQRVEFDLSESTIHVTTFGGSVWHGPAAPAQP